MLEGNAMTGVAPKRLYFDSYEVSSSVTTDVSQPLQFRKDSEEEHL
jgi:hypothetical protein